MPEGPSILLMKESIQKFEGGNVLEVSGNAKIDKEILIGKTLKKIKTFGKQTYLVFDDVAVRIHLLMFGSHSVDEQTKPDRQLRLALLFPDGGIYFYTCHVKMVDSEFLTGIDWEADVMSDNWNPGKAEKKLKSNPEMMVCDALMDQDIFSGVGNIIKNEVLFRIGVQPESFLGKMPDKKIKELIKEARNYSFDFLEWKRDFTLKKHWLAHTKKVCPKCGNKLVKKQTGKGKRRSFFCETDQQLYH
ncbi:DNA-formamidopyrimidine glycosylase family protein [Chryseobacterium salviniae]|uniref:DNA-formamidopyrimidine glycosylase family protein n=1 Tax=Chryseobacterium salviniae TaxID=3101750 RepID=A0ABU6HUT3_9FLAO|nr:DNA-formamidopyrimidine glycosylase family protein [Chryseobacterium sp. T9W2-O]MEC3876819.1 DNA-formamidopyrimidine glycosylase family protein [Chryseobacterium sp. T9W2-O]